MKEVRNRPLVTFRAAGTDQITQQVQVKTQKGQRCSFPPARGQGEAD